jgi:hypothetical protein
MTTRSSRVGGLVALFMVAIAATPTCMITAHLSEAAGSSAREANLGSLGWLGVLLVIAVAASPGALVLGLGIRLRRAHMADGAEARLQADAFGQPSTLSLLTRDGTLSLIWLGTLVGTLTAIAAAVVAAILFSAAYTGG